MTLHEPHQAGKPNEHAKHLSLHALVLAAGRASRFGGSKLQARYRDRPLLAYPLAVVAAARERRLIDAGYVVVTADDEASSQLVRSMRLEPVTNRLRSEGFRIPSSSGSLPWKTRAKPAAALILLGDQPLVRLEVVEAIIVERGMPGEGRSSAPAMKRAPMFPGTRCWLNAVCGP